MIVTHIMGGLGNQLFEYAVGRCLAYKNNTELKLETSECEFQKSHHHSYYRLGDFNIKENFVKPENIANLKRVTEKEGNIFDPDLFNEKDNIFLYGYWQHEEYFKEIEDIIRKEITPKKTFGKNSAKWKKKILSAECAVSLHIRHGDFLTPLIRHDAGILPLSYYLTCIDELKKDCPNMTVFVFSDDLEWAENNFKLDVPVEFVKNCEKDSDEMFLMSYCKHNIIVNSTFSWWGAWLNQNPDKKVFVPSKIMSTDKKLRYIFGLPEKFIEIPIDDSQPSHIEFPPTLSIILYVSNDEKTLELSLTSILSQNFKDYEVIIIDSTTDSSGKILNRLTKDRKNIFIIKENSSVGKLSAWNKGIEHSRGQYVLLLTAKNFIISQTNNILDQFLYNYQEVYTQKQNSNYINSTNYSEIYPNVICSTQAIKEDINGTITVGGVQNKKFSIQVDARFQELKGITELEINDRDKLILLATQQINNLLGTKFFKRNFVNENKIRFDETLTRRGSSELKFLTDTFLHTEKITFIHQPFFGNLK